MLALSRRDGRAAAALDAAGIDWRVAPAGKGQHLRAALWLLQQVRSHRPALIWTSLTQATLLGQLAGVLIKTPVVSWQHNAVLKPANLRLLRLMRRPHRPVGGGLRDGGAHHPRAATAGARAGG